MPRLLSTYLNDHLAGATAGLELARRAARSNRGSTYGRVLSELVEEIAEDRSALEAVMSRHIDLAALTERARSQHRKLERQRREAAVAAFG